MAPRVIVVGSVNVDLVATVDRLPVPGQTVTGGTFARRRVDIGSRVGDNYEVTAGLKPGDQVVAEGALFLQFAESQ